MPDPDKKSIDQNPRSDEPSQDSPPLAAAFLVKFDMRKGYTLTWQRSVPDLQLEGVVEYKSLPSGLHNVEEDLIYFIHEGCAGVSAFYHKSAEESQRNALMLAVGVLVPLGHGRLGKSWRHVKGLKTLARQVASDPDRTDALEEYWDQYKLREDPPVLDGATESSPSLKVGSPPRQQDRASGRRRGISDATAIIKATNTVAPYHPALSLPELVTSFGPLIFPLYKAALLRKRILIMGGAPSQTACNYVYGISVFSSLPTSLLRLLSSDTFPPLSLRPLFNVGIHDIPLLSNDRDSSWIACTTDDVLATKPSLFDVLVTLPPSHTEALAHKAYPKLIPSEPSLSRSLPRHAGLRATQRDVRRYHNLRSGLRMLPSSLSTNEASLPENDTDSNAVSFTSSTSSLDSFSNNSVVEPVSWPQLAYTSFMWWASAGENGATGIADENVENEQDSGMLLADLDVDEGPYQVPRRPSEEPQVSKELALVSYFHSLTSVIFSTLADIIDVHDADESANGERYQDEESSGDEHDADPLLGETSRRKVESRDTLIVTAEDMARMGLDVWSAADRSFVEELIAVWWGREARVRGGEVRCCGVRVL